MGESVAERIDRVGAGAVAEAGAVDGAVGGGAEEALRLVVSELAAP